MGLLDALDHLFDKVGDLIGGSSPDDLKDLGAEPTPQFDDPVLNQIQASVDEAQAQYDAGMEELKDAPRMPSAGAQAQQTIDNVMNASPEQLERMGAQADALNAAEEIRSSVAESEHDLADRNAAHEQIIEADRAEIHAKAVEAGAEDALARAKDA
jgi:hypothetical protein